MTTHINMDLFSLFDIEIPEPTHQDLKWKARIDKLCGNLTPRNTKTLLKEFGKSISGSGNPWRVAYICTLRKDIPDLEKALDNGTKIPKIKKICRPSFCGNLATYNGWAYSDTTREILALCFTPQKGGEFYPQNARAEVAKKWLYDGCSAKRSDLLTRAIPELSVDELNDFALREPELFGDANDKLSKAIKHKKGLDFVKALIDAGASPYVNIEDNVKEALTGEDFETAQYLQSQWDEKTGTTLRKPDEKNLGWAMLDDTTLMRTRTKPDETAMLVEYFDFAARRMRQVQEDDHGAHPLFTENFADILDTPLFQEALAEFNAKGGRADLAEGFDQNKVAKLKTVKPVTPKST